MLVISLAPNQKKLLTCGEELNIEVDSERDLDLIRAELEILIAKKLYNLTSSDWDYICSSFVFGETDTKAELDEIIRLSKEYWDY
ncbi:MAG: hypothetical protein NT007_11840 [Candidatus Kapabacteria bacterium]|nr:hypothetical protein [Candidatus Kapabacteria bacterium]